MWVCAYCGSEVAHEPDEMCCGELHQVWVELEPGDDGYEGEDDEKEPTEEQKYRDYVETYGHNTTTMRIGNLNNWR